MAEVKTGALAILSTGITKHYRAGLLLRRREALRARNAEASNRSKRPDRVRT